MLKTVTPAWFNSIKGTVEYIRDRSDQYKNIVFGPYKSAQLALGGSIEEGLLRDKNVFCDSEDTYQYAKTFRDRTKVEKLSEPELWGMKENYFYVDGADAVNYASMALVGNDPRVCKNMMSLKALKRAGEHSSRHVVITDTYNLTDVLGSEAYPIPGSIEGRFRTFESGRGRGSG